jgi:hypothetical protein
MLVLPRYLFSILCEDGNIQIMVGFSQQNMNLSQLYNYINNMLMPHTKSNVVDTIRIFYQEHRASIDRLSVGQ